MDSTLNESITSLQSQESQLDKGDEEERRGYLLKVSEALNHIRSEVGNDGWWVVGGIARDAYINNGEFAVRNPEGGLRDMDILCKNSIAPALDKAVGTYKGPLHIGGALTRLFLNVGDNEALLTYRKTHVPVPYEVFNTFDMNFQGVEFPTLPCNTLLHLYLLAGKMREYDFANALDLARALPEVNQPTYEDETLYKGFHKFHKEVYFKGRGGDDVCLLKTVATAYKNSLLNKIVPINSPAMRKFLYLLWDELDK